MAKRSMMIMGCVMAVMMLTVAASTTRYVLVRKDNEWLFVCRMAERYNWRTFDQWSEADQHKALTALSPHERACFYDMSRCDAATRYWIHGMTR